MRVSPVIPEFEAPATTGSRLQDYVAAARRFAGILLDLESVDPITHEPASAAIENLGRFIASHSQQERVSIIQVTAGVLDESATIYRRDELQEYTHADRYDATKRVRPVPRASIRIFGSGYEDYSATKDTFMCSIGVFDLQDGGRLLQATPYQWEKPVYGFEFIGNYDSLAELFGNYTDPIAMMKYARISLGVIEAGGSFTEFRQFNQMAFGMDLLPILERVSSPTVREDLNFQLQNGRIQQFD